MAEQTVLLVLAKYCPQCTLIRKLKKENESIPTEPNKEKSSFFKLLPSCHYITKQILDINNIHEYMQYILSRQY